MAGLKLKAAGVVLMGLGVWLFILAVRDMQAGTGRTLTGLASVFCTALGFGLLLIPGPEAEKPDNLDGSEPGNS